MTELYDVLFDLTNDDDRILHTSIPRIPLHTFHEFLDEMCNIVRKKRFTNEQWSQFVAELDKTLCDSSHITTHQNEEDEGYEYDLHRRPFAINLQTIHSSKMCLVVALAIERAWHYTFGPPRESSELNTSDTQLDLNTQLPSRLPSVWEFVDVNVGSIREYNNNLVLPSCCWWFA